MDVGSSLDKLIEDAMKHNDGKKSKKKKKKKNKKERTDRAMAKEINSPSSTLSIISQRYAIVTLAPTNSAERKWLQKELAKPVTEMDPMIKQQLKDNPKSTDFWCETFAMKQKAHTSSLTHS